MVNDPIAFFKKQGISPRPEQLQILRTLKDNWNKYRVFCVAAPPGVGKTYIATSIADALESSYVLTSSLQLQEQYEDSWDELVNLKGRRNYTCALNSNFTVDAAPCTIKKDLVKSCKTNCICPYYNQRRKAVQSKAMITNPPFMLYSTHCGFAAEHSSEWNERDALIIDEAHHLEGQLVAFASSDIDIDKLTRLYDIDLDDIKFTTNESTNLKLISVLLARLNERQTSYKGIIEREYKKNTSTNIADLAKWASSFQSIHSEAVKRITEKSDSLDKVIQPLNMFFQSAADCKWVISKVPEKNAIKISPLYASFLFEKHLGKLARKFVFMSATLGTKKAFCDELGIDEKDCLYIDVESPFPPELSPIIVLPLIKLSRDVYQENVRKIGPIIETILNEHAGLRGIIHSVTYDIQLNIHETVSKGVRSRLTSRNMVKYMPGQKPLSNMELLESHTSRSDSVLMSPSMATGIDLKDDLSAFQIIVKLPWPNLGDERIKRKSQIDSDWYSNGMWRTLIQSSCRSTRHEKDSAVTYILDENFVYFYSKWKKNLPNWFKARITI